jgi:hypothetical protein
MTHFGMEPHTIQVNSPNENGDVESLNGALKRRLKQHLLLRCSTDFDSVESYRAFLDDILHRANSIRSDRLAEELKEMPLLTASKLAEYNEHLCTVRNSSTITVNRRVYSMPSRLIGREVVVRQYEDHIDVLYKNTLQLTAPWIGRDNGNCINYRHIIGSLVRKPGAFKSYRFREELFPSEVFRWAWGSLSDNLNDRTAEREYLQLLHKAATTMQCEVEEALSALRSEGSIPRLDHVLLKCRPVEHELPRLKPLVVSLKDYDDLLAGQEVSA